MRIYPLAAAAILTLAAGGCSESDTSTSRIEPVRTTEDEKEQALLQMQLQSLDKAKGVEGLLIQDAKNLEGSLKEQEQPAR